MSETAPEQQVPAARPASSPGTPGGQRENVFTRKLGPLPMWVWMVIVAAIILVYVLFKKKKKGSGSSSSSGKQQGTRFGAFLVPEVIRTRVPHVQHRQKRHHRDPDPDPDPGGQRQATALEADRQNAARDPGAGVRRLPGHNRRHMRGEPIPGELVSFKTAEQGQTPTLTDVANRYDTEPEAIVQEAEGRGYPASTAWKRYVALHDWSKPLPPATEFSILAHPSG